MTLPIYQVDAFANQLFRGNPAAVCPLSDWLPDKVMQKIALENNLSETAFFIREGTDYQIRWFTPALEVDLCGHATLATAHVIFEELNYDKSTITFHSKSGALIVKKIGANYQMNFPTDKIIPINNIPKELIAGLKMKPIVLFKGSDDYMAILDKEETIKNLSPDFSLLKKLKVRGIITTAPGEKVDFVSRCFYPAAGIDEDPVTGSAHTTMIPYWAKKLRKNNLTARQLSTRGGTVICEYNKERVNLGGSAVTYLKGAINI